LRITKQKDRVTSVILHRRTVTYFSTVQNIPAILCQKTVCIATTSCASNFKGHQNICTSQTPMERSHLQSANIFKPCTKWIFQPPHGLDVSVSRRPSLCAPEPFLRPSINEISLLYITTELQGIKIYSELVDSPATSNMRDAARGISAMVTYLEGNNPTSRMGMSFFSHDRNRRKRERPVALRE
jgi:hypothetical protein